MTDLAEIFARDPLSYTKEGREVELIVQKLRDSRHRFNSGDKSAGTMTPPKTATGRAAKELGDQLSLKDLGL